MLGWEFWPSAGAPSPATAARTAAGVAAKHPSTATADADVDPRVAAAQADTQGHAEALRQRGVVRAPEYSAEAEAAAFDKLRGE